MMKRQSYSLLLFLCSLFIFSHRGQAETSGRISLAGTGVSYTSNGFTFSVGGSYFRPLNEHFVWGAGLQASFNSDWTIYGPQTVLQYFFDDFAKNGFLVFTGASYSWINYKDARATESQPALSFGVAHQWVFEDGFYASAGIVATTTFDEIRTGGVFDIGMSF